MRFCALAAVVEDAKPEPKSPFCRHLAGASGEAVPRACARGGGADGTTYEPVALNANAGTASISIAGKGGNTGVKKSTFATLGSVTSTMEVISGSNRNDMAKCPSDSLAIIIVGGTATVSTGVQSVFAGYGKAPLDSLVAIVMMPVAWFTNSEHRKVAGPHLRYS